MILTQRKKRIRFQLVDGTTIEGIMLKRPLRRDGYYVVWGATVFTGPGASHASPGNIELPREKVLFTQDAPL